jgi:hypothetical protein
MSQQSVRQAARRSALDAQAVLRKERADREHRLEGLAVAVLTAIAERDALVRDAEGRAGQALLAMTDSEGLSVREAVEWCAALRCGRSPGYANSRTTRRGPGADERDACTGLAVRSSHQSGHHVDVAAAALCVQRNGPVRWKTMRSHAVRPRTPPGERGVAEPAMLAA